jgi:opacity protein-like surface antigen
MKRLLFVSLLLVLCTVLMFAAEPRTKAGSKALMFTINGLGDFGVRSPLLGEVTVEGTTYTAYGIGGKYFLSDDMALRGVLGFNSNSETQKTDAGDDKTTTTKFGLAPAIEVHFVNSAPVTAYYGAMVNFAMLSETHTPPVGTETKDSGTQFGVAALLGAEFFPWDNVSFGAEYQLGFSTTSTKRESGGVSVDGPTFTDIGFSSVAVNLQFYFGE